MYSLNQSYDNVLGRTVIEDFHVDFATLNSIMYKQSPTYNEVLNREKAHFLTELIFNLTGVKAITDARGNLYFVKGTSDLYPTIVAHYDTAQEYHPGLTIQKAGDWLYGFDITTGTQCGIGADDSVGIYFAIEMLKRLPVCKVALFYGEERGCIGSSSCDMTFFKDSLLVSQLDSRSFQNDFIVHTNGVEVFPTHYVDIIQTFLDKYDYTPANGSCTDVGALRRAGLQVASHNTACGYFNEHTDEEIIHIPSMINAMSMVYEIQSYLLENKLQLEFPYVRFVEQKSIYAKPWVSAFEDRLDQTRFSDSFYDIDEVGTGISKTANQHNDINYSLNGATSLEEIEWQFDVVEKDLTLAKVKSGKTPVSAYVAYTSISYNARTKKELYLEDYEIRDALLNEKPHTGMNACCVKDYLYNVPFNLVECQTCGSGYHLEFTAEDVYTLPDDSFQTLDEWAEMYGY